jgi:hypothetical protein
MSKARMAYFEKDDVLHLAISDEPEAGRLTRLPGFFSSYFNLRNPDNLRTICLFV